MARPRYHALAAALLAVPAYRTGGGAAVAGILAAGVLLDADHLADYAWTRWRGARSHYLAPLHGWELAAAAAALAALMPSEAPFARLPDRRLHRQSWRRWAWRRWRKAFVAGLALGWWAHLIQDVLTNRPQHPGVYSLVYRARRGFRREITGWGEHTKFHGWSNRPWYTWY